MKKVIGIIMVVMFFMSILVCVSYKVGVWWYGVKVGAILLVSFAWIMYAVHLISKGE